MKPEPLSVVFSVPLAVDEALDSVVRALQSEGFAVVSKLDIHPRTSTPAIGEVHRATLLRACYPKESSTRYFLNQHDPLIVRCSVLLQQTEDGSSVEVARPSRLLDLEHSKVRSFAAEVDWKLRKMISDLMSEIEELRASREQGAGVAAAFAQRKGNS